MAICWVEHGHLCKFGRCCYGKHLCGFFVKFWPVVQGEMTLEATCTANLSIKCSKIVMSCLCLSLNKTMLCYRWYGPRCEKTCLFEGLRTTKTQTAVWSLLIKMYHISNFLASLCSWADWFESHFIGNPEDRFCPFKAHIVSFIMYGLFLLPYMGVIHNPKMAFIFPISCILVLIFPIFITIFPNVKEKVASQNPK